MAVRKHPCPGRRCRRWLRLARDEDGGLVVFALFVLVLMLVAGGMAMDVMRLETERTRLQNTADTAVLAAASLTQQRDPEMVVADHFRAAGQRANLRDVEVTEGINFRDVRVSASAPLSTFFLRMVGINTLVAPAVGAAQERIPNVEVSLVLDISGSMRWRDHQGVPRLRQLQHATKRFIERMVEDREDLVSISIVPYAGVTSPGPVVADMLGLVRDHPFSNCPELGDDDFTRPGFGHVTAATSYAQVPHFHNWYHQWLWPQYDNIPMGWGWCPMDDMQIVYHSSDVGFMQQWVDDMVLYDGTGTHTGMKWALTLLDPASRFITTGLLAADHPDQANRPNPQFADRPADWDEPETLKVIVLMTDGHITPQMRPRHDRPLNWNAPDWTDPWAELLHQRHNDPNTRYSSGQSQNNSNSVQTLAQNRVRDHVFDLCRMAKRNGVIVYTIAFEVDMYSLGHQEMEYCATSPAHFFPAWGNELDTAFQAIAGAIQMLRLTE